MNILPYEKFTILTNLSRETLHQRLADNIEPDQYLRWPLSTNHKKYQGTLSDSTFEVTRIIHYHNSFLPRIKGQIRDGAGQTMVDIQMNLDSLTTTFFILWCSGLIFMGLIAVVSTLRNASDAITYLPKTLAAVFGLIAFGAAITFGGFKFESVQSKLFFLVLLEDIGSEEW